MLSLFSNPGTSQMHPVEFGTDSLTRMSTGVNHETQKLFLRCVSICIEELRWEPSLRSDWKASIRYKKSSFNISSARWFLIFSELFGYKCWSVILWHKGLVLTSRSHFTADIQCPHIMYISFFCTSLLWNGLWPLLRMLFLSFFMLCEKSWMCATTQVGSTRLGLK